MKDIKNYEGLYAITEDGKVWSYRRKKFLNAGTASEYKFVILYKNNIGKTHSIHRLVAEAFIPNPENLPVINHKDENKLNNAVDNLEWCTQAYNIQQSWLNRYKAVYCVELDKIFISNTEAMRALNISGTCIAACCKGKQKTAGKYHWRYVENT